ncbi:MAG: DUF3078 domain-containing protein [Fluviicola sp.]|nr:DUF3078 domain-containing protein [Fluviicola sp.]
MKNILIAAFILCNIATTFSQTDSIAKDPNWKLQGIYGLNGTQSSFVNWNAGGRNNISLLGYISGSANYKKGTTKWDNSLDLALGGIQYIGIGAPKQLQKTDDKIDFSTNYGLKMKNKWYYSILGSFRTQFLDGFAFPNDSVRVSGAMAPGYATLAIGAEYSPNDNFSVFISPLATKMTFVQIHSLADAGAFGVEKAEVDGLGNVITAGKRFRGEFGAYFKMKYNRDLAKNINMKTKLELFSNYMNNPENIDVNADVLFTFKINSWFSASLNWTLIYDDDIDIRDINGNVGPRTQFKSVLGLGVSYTMRNFEVKAKK